MPVTSEFTRESRIWLFAHHPSGKSKRALNLTSYEATLYVRVLVARAFALNTCGSLGHVRIGCVVAMEWRFSIDALWEVAVTADKKTQLGRGLKFA